MTIYQSDAAKGIAITPYPDCAGVVTTRRASFAAPAGLLLNDIIEMAVLPPNCRPVDLILECDDLDTNGAPTMTLDVGIMSGDVGSIDPARTCGAEFFSADVVGKAGGVTRPSLKTAFRVAPSNVERSIGIKVSAAAATGAAGSIGLTVFIVAE